MSQSRQSKRIEKMRAMGRWRFILIRGVLAWGIITAFLWSALTAILDGTGFIDSLVLAVPVFMLGGLGWGMLVWERINRHPPNTEAEHVSDL